MNIEWQLPSSYVHDTDKGYNLATNLINDYVAGKTAYPSKLLILIEEYFRDPDDASITLKNLAEQLSDRDRTSDILDDPESLATLAWVIIKVWSSKDTVIRVQTLLELTRSSWWLDHLWVEATIALAKSNEDFRKTVTTLATEHLLNAEEKLNKEAPQDPNDPFTLDDLWSGHIHEPQLDDSSWSWVRLLAELDFEQLFESLKSIRNPMLLNRVLESPEFHKNYSLWERLAARAESSFLDDESWNGNILLPSLIRHSKSMLFHVADGQEHPKDILEAHIRLLLARVCDTLAQRSDFLRIFRRWGTWLTRQALNFPAHESQRKTLIDSNSLLMALADRVATPFTPKVSSDLDNSWEPWVYQSMLALLHSNKPDQFSPPNIEDFLDEWDLTIDDWDSSKGQRLRDHAKQYHATRAGNYACKVLGYSIALSDNYEKHWLHMWESSVALRDILEFRPTAQSSSGWRSSDISGLMRTLLDIGLGILDCTTYEQEDQGALVKSAQLFTHLWSATTEMLSIDLYGDEFWTQMQRHLAIRRIRWSIALDQPSEAERGALLDDATVPKAAELLKEVSANTSSILGLLPMLVQNTSIESVRLLLSNAQIDMSALTASARKYEQAPTRKFNIPPHIFDLIKDLG